MIDEVLNLEAVTVEDCINNYEYKDRTVILNDGKVIGFEDMFLK